MVKDVNLKMFLHKQANSERLNTMYEYISIILNYSNKRQLFVKDIEDVVLCNEELFRALNLKIFLT